MAKNNIKEKIKLKNKKNTDIFVKKINNVDKKKVKKSSASTSKWFMNFKKNAPNSPKKQKNNDKVNFSKSETLSNKEKEEKIKLKDKKNTDIFVKKINNVDEKKVKKSSNLTSTWFMDFKKLLSNIKYFFTSSLKSIKKHIQIKFSSNSLKEQSNKAGFATVKKFSKSELLSNKEKKEYHKYKDINMEKRIKLMEKEEKIKNTYVAGNEFYKAFRLWWFLLKEKLCSKIFFIFSFGIVSLIFLMSAVFQTVPESIKPVMLIRSYRIPLALVTSYSCLTFMSFITTEMMYFKSTKTVEFVTTSIKPIRLFYSLIFAYLICVMLIITILISGCLLANAIFGNFGINRIGMIPPGMTIKQYLEGLGMLYYVQLNDANSTLGFINNNFVIYYQNSPGVPPFSISGDGALLSLSYNYGVRIMLLFFANLTIQISIFAALGLALGSIFSKQLKLLLGMSPLYLFSILPSFIYPILVQTYSRIFNYITFIPIVNLIFIPGFLAYPGFNERIKWIILLPQFFFSVALNYISLRIFKLGIIHYSTEGVFKQYKNVFKQLIYS